MIQRQRLRPEGSAYPTWFRARFLPAAGRPADLSRLHGIHVSTIYRYRARVERTGSLARKRAAGGRSSTTTAAQDRALWTLVKLRPDARYDELLLILREMGMPHFSRGIISRRLAAMGFTRKRLRVFAQQRDEERRIRFWDNGPEGPVGIAGVNGVPPLSLIDIDECGVVLNEVERRVGLAPRGQRAELPGKYSRGAVRHNVILAIDMIRGPVAFWVLPVNVDANIFRLCIELMVIPALRPEPHAFHFRRVLLWDNLRAHFDADTLRAVREAGHISVARPPYSPDMAPIESAFSKLKGYLRRHKDVIRETNLVSYIMDGIRTITPENVRGWFHHCHYNAPGYITKAYTTPRFVE